MKSKIVRLAVVGGLIAGSTAYATTVTCAHETTSSKSKLSYSTSPLRLEIRTVVGGKEFNSTYLADKIACGENINSVSECSVSESWDVPSKGNFGASFSCESGQQGDLYFENGSIQVQCTKSTGERMQRSLSNCEAIR
jgi:hypothetical protein